jgi:Putative beta-barrel porin 2
MPDRRLLYVSLTLLSWFMAAPKAHALLAFDDGKERVYVTGTYSFGYDTNIFAQSVARGALTQAWSLQSTFSRRAGIISVDGTIEVNSENFNGISGQDFSDPGVTLTFTKGIGRTTGSLGFTAQKQNTPDPVANNRSVSWTYGSTLDLRYPVNQRFYFTNSSGVTGTYYTNKALFSDLESFTDGLDVNLVYDSKLDLDTGYDFAYSDTRDTRALDQGFTLGADGSIFPKLNGSLVVGDTWRQAVYSHARSETFQAITAGAALKWALSRQISIGVVVTKGLSISSTDISTDTLSSAVSADLALGRRLRGTIGLDYIPTTFLGRAGAGRKDYLWEVPVTLYTSITTHLRTSVTYAYETNYSNFSIARFVRETLSLSLTATY